MPAPVPSQPTAIKSTKGVTLEVATPGGTPTFQQVALSKNLTVKPTGQTQKLETYDSIFDRAVKTGLSGEITIDSAAADDDAAMAMLKAAAYAATHDLAILLWRLKHPDGSYLSGQLIVRDGAPMTPVRGVAEWQFVCETDGDMVYTDAASAA